MSTNDNLAVKYNILENGEIIQLSRATLKRNRALSKLLVSFSNSIKEPCEVFHEQSYRWEEDIAAYRMPDISIVCNPSTKNDIDINSMLWFILEVLSKSTEDVDRKEKMDLYAKVGVKEYWLLDPETLIVKCYLNKNNKFEFVKDINIKESNEISFISKEDVKIDVSNIM